MIAGIQALKPALRTASQDPLLKGLQVYVVGGAVRDALMGLPAGDLDWVVVGASPEQMSGLGFIPVGGDFPVFLHPLSKQEFALARTERKSGKGYKGFTFYTGADVTLQQDLLRRDLTVNAIAVSLDGKVADPFNGCEDITNKVLRHVGPAFAEDPVRLLRLARFAARFSSFSIANETMSLARKLVQLGEVDALVAERVWQEISKGLATQSPERMFNVLQQVGALNKVLPELQWSDNISKALARASSLKLDTAGKYAVLCSNSNNPQALSHHVRAPSEYKACAVLLQYFLHAVNADIKNSSAVLDVLQRCDAMRKPKRFELIVRSASCLIDAGKYTNVTYWLKAIEAINSVDAGAIARAIGNTPQKIKEAVYNARLSALQNL